MSGFSVVLRPRFRRSHGISWKKKIVLVLVFIFFFFFPCTVWRMETYTPSPCTVCPMGAYILPPLQYVHVRNVSPPDSIVRAFPERVPFRFRGHTTRVLVVFPWYFWTRLLRSADSCAQLTTDRSSLLSFLLGKIRSRTPSVRIGFEPYCPRTILPGRYRFSQCCQLVALRCSPSKSDCRCGSNHFNVVCLLSSLPQSKMAFVRFSVIFTVALILNLCPSCFTFSQHDECSPLWFCFRLRPPV